MKLSTGALISSEKPGSGSASVRRKSRNSHCGINAMNGAGVSRCDRSPIVQSRPASRISAPVDPVVRPLQKALEHPQLVEDLHRRRVDRVAAEIAEEVGMLFQHSDAAPGPREQQAGHHSGRPAADDDQIVSHGQWLGSGASVLEAS